MWPGHSLLLVLPGAGISVGFWILGVAPGTDGMGPGTCSTHSSSQHTQRQHAAVQNRRGKRGTLILKLAFVQCWCPLRFSSSKTPLTIPLPLPSSSPASHSTAPILTNQHWVLSLQQCLNLDRLVQSQCWITLLKSYLSHPPSTRTTLKLSPKRWTSSRGNILNFLNYVSIK